MNLLLLEVGPRHRSLWIEIPSGHTKLVNLKKFTRNCTMEAEDGLAGRRLLYAFDVQFSCYQPVGGHFEKEPAITNAVYHRFARLDHEIPDARRRPAIRTNFLSTWTDRDRAVADTEIARKIMQHRQIHRLSNVPTNKVQSYGERAPIMP
ncbi:hypothetical protein IVB22_34680 [Bradyrhizobium sp. 190]|uniref:hypothetical protein n=1 Tax=Bradyrhizobium sp. 190 TaxID=2782658 RepID=UPI001FFA8C73|nr:hypothetical protein [Bradyrhizobium sp. 190]MCK1517544.1 hypothetical protein [Bradyrhizobium sp. 190]